MNAGANGEMMGNEERKKKIERNHEEKIQ